MPQSEPARYARGRALIRGRQCDEAQRVLDALAKAAPDNLFYTLALVDLDISRQQLGKAAQTLELALQARPSSYPLRAAWADLLGRQQRFAEAGRAYRCPPA